MQFNDLYLKILKLKIRSLFGHAFFAHVTE